MSFLSLRTNALDNIIILCRRFPQSAAVAIHLAPRVGWLIGGKGSLYGTGFNRQELLINERLALVGITKMSIQIT